MIRIILVAIATCVVFAYVCRLDKLHVKTHELRFILMHVALSTAAAVAGLHAWQNNLDAQDVACLMASGLWIWISYPSRSYDRSKEPKFAPIPINVGQLKQARGGKIDS